MVGDSYLSFGTSHNTLNQHGSEQKCDKEMHFRNGPRSTVNVYSDRWASTRIKIGQNCGKTNRN
jgi:hypothetical protein